MRFRLPTIIAIALFASTACSDGDASRACETSVNCFVGEICYAGFCSPDPGTPDAGADSNEPDTDDRDTEEPDAAEPDAEEPDAEEPDAAEPDAEEPDAEEPDAEEPDAAEPTDDGPYTIEVTWTTSSGPGVDLDLHYCLEGATGFVSQPSPLCVNVFGHERDWLGTTTPVSVVLTQDASTGPGPERVEHAPIESETTTYVGIRRSPLTATGNATATLRINRGDSLLFEAHRVINGQAALWFGAVIHWSADGPPTIVEGPECVNSCTPEGLHIMPVSLP